MRQSDGKEEGTRGDDIRAWAAAAGGRGGANSPPFHPGPPTLLEVRLASHLLMPCLPLVLRFGLFHSVKLGTAHPPSFHLSKFCDSLHLLSCLLPTELRHLFLPLISQG